MKQMLKVVERFYGDVFDRAYITKGLPLADALTSGPVAALYKSPVILANHTLTENQKAILSDRTANKVIQWVAKFLLPQFKT